MEMSKNAKNAGVTASLLISSMSALGASDIDKQEMSVVDIAGHQVPVVKDGLYDRFRSNPPLSVIKKEAPDIDLSWFEGIKKAKVDAGFVTYSPNFYYKTSRITGVFTADLTRLRELQLIPNVGEGVLAHPSERSGLTPTSIFAPVLRASSSIPLNRYH